MYLIQETKLVEKVAFPPFAGFNSIRVDRPTTHRGEGLLTQVKEGVVFQCDAEHYSPPLERVTIETQLSRRRWAKIHNLYAAPVKGPASSDSRALNDICVVPFAFTTGDSYTTF